MASSSLFIGHLWETQAEGIKSALRYIIELELQLEFQLDVLFSATTASHTPGVVLEAASFHPQYNEPCLVFIHLFILKYALL